MQTRTRAGRAACAACATLAALAAAPAAHAQTYRVQATGFISSVSGATQFLDGSVQPGTPYTYSFIFNTQATDAEPGDPNNAQYELPGDVYGATVSVGDYTLTHQPVVGSIPAALYVGSDPAFNSFGTYVNNYIEPSTDGALVTSTNAQAAHPTSGFVGLILLSQPPFLLMTDAQPALSAYAPAHFRTNIQPGPFALSFRYNPSDPNADTVDIAGSLTSLSAAPYALPAPEPSPVAALGLGIFGLSALALKARRRTA